MHRRIALALTALLVLAATGCAKPRVWVPPRIDLHRYGTLGMIQFDASPALAPQATQQFVATLHAAQAGVPVLELGGLPDVLRTVGHESLGPDAARAIGERFRVNVLVIGDLVIEQPRPTFSMDSILSANARADIHGSLRARLLDAQSGATIWSDQARGQRTVAQVNVIAGQRPDFAATDPEGVQAQLVDSLIASVTTDFRGYWARQ